MPTELLYLYDSYQKNFKAKVIDINEREVILNKTIFHPLTGGIANDIGFLFKNKEKYKVMDVKLDLETNNVIHILENEPNFSIGDEIEGIIDWNRRYKLMRLHTAAHIISSIMYKDYGALITGGHIDENYAKDDFSLEKFDKAIFEEAIRKANEIVKKAIEVKIYFLKREEALKIPGIIKLAEKMPPEVEKLRIVEIPEVDIQADGGPHVKNTKEIGEIILLKIENKGKNKKRIYYNVL
ncbi:MAG: alanyl-tRNA editing protein AlaXM [Nitrososphaerota archaeon]